MESRASFGRRLKFVKIKCTTTSGPQQEERLVLWPCLWFEDMPTLQRELGARGMLDCVHRRHRILIEYLNHALCTSSSSSRSSSTSTGDSPVLYLFGSKTPQGRRLWFTRGLEDVCDYKYCLPHAIHHMRNEPVFLDALYEVSPFWEDLAAEEIRQRLEEYGHAAAA